MPGGQWGAPGRSAVGATREEADPPPQPGAVPPLGLGSRLPPSSPPFPAAPHSWQPAWPDLALGEPEDSSPTPLPPAPLGDAPGALRGLLERPRFGAGRPNPLSPLETHQDRDRDRAQMSGRRPGTPARAAAGTGRRRRPLIRPLSARLAWRRPSPTPRAGWDGVGVGSPSRSCPAQGAGRRGAPSPAQPGLPPAARGPHFHSLVPGGPHSLCGLEPIPEPRFLTCEGA